MATEFTAHYQLAKPDFNLFGWHDDVNGNSDTIDSILFTLTGLSNFVGAWTNSTNYTVGQRVIDPDDASIWNALVTHTSSAAGAFVDDRVLHPSYWSPVTSVPFDRGEWVADTFYAIGDIAHSTPDGLFGVAISTHTSSPLPATMRTDIANWSILFDAQDLTLASNIGFVPAGTIGATNVQAAVLEAYSDASAFATSAANAALASANATTAAAVAALLPAGTKLLFASPSVPAGWTLDTTHNNKALRLVNTIGGGGATGGSTNFTTVFSNTRVINQVNLPNVAFTITGTADDHRHGPGTLGGVTGNDSPVHKHQYTGPQNTGNSASSGPDRTNIWQGTQNNNSGNPDVTHTHSVNVNTGVTSFSGALNITGSAASGGLGTAMDFAVQYVDVVIGTKN